MSGARGSKFRSIIVLAVALVSSAGFARAESSDPMEHTAPEAPPPDKSHFNLFHPTPPELVRTLSTDRPDKTNSPSTVDAGHVQLELDLVNYTYSRVAQDHARHRSDQLSFGEDWRVGILNDAEISITFAAFQFDRERNLDDRTNEYHRGFGDMTFALKLNLFGNEGGSGMALTPFLKFPTAQDNLGNGTVEGGFQLPIALEIPEPWDLGFMPEGDFDNGDNGKAFLQLSASCSLGYTIAEKLRLYVEVWGAVNTARHGPPLGTLDTGFSFKITPNVQIDGGINIGITHATDDFNPFAGISFRF